MNRREFEKEARKQITEKLAAQGVSEIPEGVMIQLIELAVQGAHHTGEPYEKYEWDEFRIHWFGLEAQQAMYERDYYRLTVH